MAVPYICHLAARLHARFHVQVELIRSGAAPQTPAAIPTKARVVRVFRGNGAINVGDEIMFSVHVAGRNGEVWEDFCFLPYETYIQATYMEVFLNGEPPRCEVAQDECIPLVSSTRTPRLRSSRIAYMVEYLRWNRYSLKRWIVRGWRSR
jgi:hypothetical protein